MLSHYGVPALCPTLKRHRWPLTLQGLDTGGLLGLTGSGSHRLYIPHRTGAPPLQILLETGILEPILLHWNSK